MAFFLFCSHLKDYNFLQPTFLLQLRVFESSSPQIWRLLHPVCISIYSPNNPSLLFSAFSLPGGGAALDRGGSGEGRSGGLPGKGYSGVGSVAKEGDQMSLEELLTVDLEDSACLKASRRKRMTRQRRPVGSYFALPGPFLPSVVPPSPPPISPAIGESGLRFILQKELRNSDVSSLGRIVLPKKESEIHLPVLTSKEGLLIDMDDWDGIRVWTFKYRYWPNNKSRMYILEQTGDFIKTHGLRHGDLVLILKDDNAGKFVIQGRKTRKEVTRPIHARRTRSDIYMDQGSSSLGTGAIGSVPITKAPPTMATTYLEVTPAAVVDTPENQSLIPILNEMSPDGLFFHEDFLAYSPFDFSNGSSGASPWLQPDPCIGLDINLSFDEFF